MLHGAFGEQLGRSFCLGSPPTLIRQTPGGLPLAMTEIQYTRRAPSFTLPLASEDAYLVGLQLKDVQHHEVWLAGRLVSDGAWPRGAAIFYDLAHHPVFFCEEPLHQLTFYAPKRAIAELYEQFDPRDSELNIIPGQAVRDETIRSIGEALLPYLRGNENARVVDHLLYAFCGHLAERYGSKKLARTHQGAGGLAPWQLRRARELLRESMSTGISLQEVADACRLSSSAFVKGFKKSMGVPPYQWLIAQRIEWAIELMQSSSLSLVDVALTCGFSDQSHFTRMFAQKMGVSPGAYRRAWPSKAA